MANFSVRREALVRGIFASNPCKQLGDITASHPFRFLDLGFYGKDKEKRKKETRKKGAFYPRILLFLNDVVRYCFLLFFSSLPNGKRKENKNKNKKKIT